MSGPVTLDRYRLLGQLGEGAFGVVYLAFDPKLEREVAIKLVKPELVDDPDVQLRFRREWKAIGKLHHPNILELLDYSGDDSEWLYIVTERLQGRTLHEATKERTAPIAPPLAMAAVHEVALALEHAHEQGIVHRDVKPENIFLEPNGRVVLCDFGIAFALGPGADTTMRGRNTQLLGSPLYMSPEQIRGDGTVGPASDLFALGAVAYRLLSGHDAFVESTILGVLKRIQAGEFHPLPDELLASAPDACALVTKLLSPRAEDRFASATALAERLFELTRESGQGDPRRLLKQGLSGIVGEAKAPKPVVALDDIDGDAKTYVTRIARGSADLQATATQSFAKTSEEDTAVFAGVSHTVVSTGAMHETGEVTTVSPWVWLLAGVALAGLGAGGALLWPRLFRKLPVVPVALVPEPAEAGGKEPSLPPPSQPERPPPQLPESAPEPVVVKAPPHPQKGRDQARERDAAREREAAKEREPAREPPKEREPARDPAKDARPAEAQKGKLRIVVVPWGVVFVDGNRAGVTPEIREIELPAGRHTLRVVNPDFAPHEEMVEIGAGTTRVRVDLEHP